MAKRPASSTFIQRSRAVGAAQKAAFHELTGAGRRQVKREFFGLSTSDEEAIVTRIETDLEKRLRAP